MKVMPSKTWSKTEYTQVTSLLRQDGNKKFKILAKWEKNYRLPVFFVHTPMFNCIVCLYGKNYLSVRKAVFSLLL